MGIKHAKVPSPETTGQKRACHLFCHLMCKEPDNSSQHDQGASGASTAPSASVTFHAVAFFTSMSWKYRAFFILSFRLDWALSSFSCGRNAYQRNPPLRQHPACSKAKSHLIQTGNKVEKMFRTATDPGIKSIPGWNLHNTVRVTIQSLPNRLAKNENY